MLIRKPAMRYFHGCVWQCVTVILIAPSGLLLAQTLATNGGLESKPPADPQADLPPDAAEHGLAVAAILELPRKTPADRLVAVFTLLDLGADRVAKRLLAPLLERPLTGEERAKLVTHFGSAKFLRLARLERPRAEQVAETAQFTGARQFAEACLKAAADLARDRKRIAALVSQLHDPQAEVRHAARVDLQATGTAGIVACLHALAALDADSSANHGRQRAHLLAALAGLHPATDAPLLAMLASCDGLLSRDLAELAGHLHMPAAIPWLAKLVACGSSDATSNDQARSVARQALAEMGISSPTPEAMRALVLREINHLQKVAPATDRDPVLWWSWSPAKGAPAKKQLAAHEVSPDQFKTLTLARLSNLLICGPDPTPSERQLALIYCLEALPLALDSKQSARAPIDQETSACGQRLADSLSVDGLSATLTEAIGRDQLRAAMAVARQLGQLGDQAALAAQLGRPSPLVRTLRHPSTELRFTALQAVMELTPEHSFAGSSYLPDALWAFSAGSGPAEALIISALTKRRSDWAGGLRELGYEATPAATGREALQAAARSSRLALVLTDANLSRSTAREVHYQLRASTQAGRVPMAIVCAGAQLLKFDRLAATDPLLLAAPRPADQTHLAEIVERLEQLADPPLASEAVRLERAEQALDWLTQLLQLPATIHGNIYQELRQRREIAGQTLFQPGLAAASLRLLEHLGTADSQLKLVDYASGKTLPIENRRAAANAFAASVDQYGILLTTEQIRAQYERHNTSQADELQTQQVLGKLLDVLEAER